MSIRNQLLVRFLLGSIMLVCLSFSAFRSVEAIVIRHDKSDAASVKLGEQFESVCRVIPDGSCTLITNKWVVTAAHVAESIRPDSELQFNDAKYRVKKVIIHPKGISPRRGRPPEVDLALVELVKPVVGIEPTGIYRKNDELRKMLFIVGYGDYGNPKNGLSRWDGNRRAATNIVDDAGPKRIFMKFDEPPKATEFEGVGGPGDSGGPALIKKGGKVYIVGVSSGSMNGKPGQYGVIDVFTRVSSYADWIDKTMSGKP